MAHFLILFSVETPFTNSTPTPAPPKVGCSPPPHIQYGIYNPIQSHYDNSDVVTFICNTNYEIVGTSNKLTCTNSRWTPQIPICKGKKRTHTLFTQEGVLTLELSSYLLEVPNNANTSLSQFWLAVQHWVKSTTSWLVYIGSLCHIFMLTAGITSSW